MNKTVAKLSLALAALLPPMASTALGQAQPQPPVVSPFDKDDPEIQRLRTLNWKAVDFDAQDLETRTVALLAMQQVMSMTGGKASARLELLIDYIDQNKLGEAYVDKQQAANLPPLISYDEARKVAVAFVKFALIAPAGTVTVEGTVNGTAVRVKPRPSFAESVTIAPPAGAGFVRCSTPSGAWPPMIFVG